MSDTATDPKGLSKSIVDELLKVHRAGMLAGLKEAVELVSNMPRRAVHGGPYEGAAAEIPSADEALAAIRARIAEIDGEANAAPIPHP